MSFNHGVRNTRGAHNNFELDQVKNLIHLHNHHLFTILETKLNPNLTSWPRNFINPYWKLPPNLNDALYRRILVVLNPLTFTLSPINSTWQIIHFHAIHIPSSACFYLSIIYANNSVTSRYQLLNFLPSLRQDTHPWLAIGNSSNIVLSCVIEKVEFLWLLGMLCLLMLLFLIPLYF